MAGIARSRPQPIAQHVHVDIKKRNELIAIKAELRANYRGINGRGLFALMDYPDTWYRAPGLAPPAGFDAHGRHSGHVVGRDTFRDMEVANGMMIVDGREDEVLLFEPPFSYFFSAPSSDISA